jgi:hypothetical protein
MYGVQVYSEDGGWLTEEVRDDETYEYTVPWMQCVDEEAESSGHLARYLLQNLPEDPPGDEIDKLYSWELIDLLEERTGLTVQSYGWEYGSLFLGFKSEHTSYDWEAVDLKPELLEVSDEQRRMMAWVSETLRVTLLHRPAVKVLVSYG